MIRATLLTLTFLLAGILYESKGRIASDLVEHEIRVRDQASGLWRRVVDGPERHGR